QVDDDALFTALLGDIDDAGHDRIGGRAGGHGLAVETDGAARGFRQAEQRLHDLAAPRPDKPVEAEDLPGMEGEAYAVELGGVAELEDLEHGCANRRGALGEDVIDIAADHQGDDFGLAGLVDPALADHLAVAEHRI